VEEPYKDYGKLRLKRKGLSKVRLPCYL